MNKNIKELEAYALGDDDLRNILGSDISIIPYANLNDVNNIDEIFDNKGRAIILFATSEPNVGHWLCLHKNGDEIEYFDPYGNCIDCNRKWLTKSKLIELHEDKPVLMKLLKASGKNVYYNSYAFQEDGNNINTCGKHCAVRLLFKNLNLDEYLDMIKKSNLSPDVFVSKYIFNIIKK